MKSRLRRSSLNAWIPVLLVAVLSALPAAGQVYQAKVWIVNNPQSDNVQFPAPSAQEDVDFATDDIDYHAQGQNTGPEYCVTLGTFLAGCAQPTVPPGTSQGLHFTGYVNPNLGNRVATVNTAINRPNYGVIIEFKGTVDLTNGQRISMIHDDGVALMIDGVPVSGFSGGVLYPIYESVTFAGTTGAHSIDLLYGNAALVGRGDEAWILFKPNLNF